MAFNKAIAIIKSFDWLQFSLFTVLYIFWIRSITCNYIIILQQLIMFNDCFVFVAHSSLSKNLFLMGHPSAYVYAH